MYGQPQPPGYGPPPRPPRRSGAGLAALLVVGTLIVVGGGIGIWALGKNGGRHRAAVRTHRLTTPQALPGGYEQENSTAAPAHPTRGFEPCGGTATDIGAEYLRSGQSASFLGCYGSIADPAVAISGYAVQVTEPKQVNGRMVRGGWSVPLREYPAGEAADRGARLECGVLGVQGVTPDNAVCLWADHSTWGRVQLWDVSHPALGRSPGPLSPEQLADLTRQFRDAMVVPE